MCTVNIANIIGRAIVTLTKEDVRILSAKILDKFVGDEEIDLFFGELPPMLSD